LLSSQNISLNPVQIPPLLYAIWPSVPGKSKDKEISIFSAWVNLPFESTVILGTDMGDPYVEGVTPVFASVTTPSEEIDDMSPLIDLNIGSSPVIPKRTCPVMPGVVEVIAPIPEPISTP